MSFKPYPKYKDSGVEWLGKVPEHWELKRLKLVFEERDERSVSGGETLLSVSAYTGVTPRSEIIDDGEFLTRAESLEGYKKCYPDDLVVNIMLAWNRGLAVTSYEGIVSPAYCVFRIKDGSAPKFINYLMRSDRSLLYFKAFSSGVIDSRLRIYPETFGSLFASIPSLEEQSSIAAFLDHETSKIDDLIVEQEKLIELLKEKRSAVISHAVTKGLDQNVKMKDSGVEWLGEVPEHWRVLKLGLVVKLRSGFAFSAGNFGHEGVAVVRMNNLKRGCLDLSEAARIPENECVEAARLREGDLVWGMSGSTGETGSLGNFARVRSGDIPCQLNQRVGRFDEDGGSVHSEFLELIIQSPQFYEQILVLVTGTAQYNVSADQVQSCRFALPPLSDQIKIIEVVKQEIKRCAALVNEANCVIDLLQERRSALISAAVTGQIDVRDFVPSKAA